MAVLLQAKEHVNIVKASKKPTPKPTKSSGLHQLCVELQAWQKEIQKKSN